MTSAIGKTIIRELEASITGNKFRLGYKNPQKPLDTSLEEAVRLVVSGKFAPTEAQCDVEVEPLSLNCAAPSNIVFTLSDKDNFQFATDADVCAASCHHAGLQLARPCRHSTPVEPHL